MSTNGLVFFYGDYEHSPGEVYPEKIEVIPRYSEEGIRWGATYNWRVAGNFLQDTTTEFTEYTLDPKIDELRLAYNVNYKDCGFKHNDGTMTKHFMDNDDDANLSGNRVMYRSWDNKGPTEYANTRSYSISIASTWLAAETNLLSWSESTTRIGDGGPIWELRNTWQGQPYKYIVSQNSKITHIQEGTITTVDGWSAPPAPYWPNDEITSQQMVKQFSPRQHGDQNYSKQTHYVTQYRYVFERLGNTNTGGFNPNTGFNPAP